MKLFKVRIGLEVAREGIVERDGCAETKKSKDKRDGEEARERETERSAMGEEDGKGCERAGEKREMSSRGDLRSGAALSSLNILADLISPALFQR